MSSKLDPVTLQVHFPATLTTDGTQRMESPKNDPKNVKNLCFYPKNVKNLCFYLKKWMKPHIFSEKTLFKTIQWLERFIFMALTFDLMFSAISSDISVVFTKNYRWIFERTAPPPPPSSSSSRFFESPLHQLFYHLLEDHPTSITGKQSIFISELHKTVFSMEISQNGDSQVTIGPSDKAETSSLNM